jgi:hypothetical protein
MTAHSDRSEAPTGSGTGGDARLRISLELDRRDAEALRLELRLLAQRHGLDPDAIRFETTPRPPELAM